jgi:uncharacterized protein (TIGR02453 family)
MAQRGDDSFTGFTRETFDYFRALSANNNRDWFTANKQTYQKVVQEPALRLVEALGSRLASEFPGIGYDTRLSGGSLMRIYRDVRFSKDKSPYKTQIAMMFTPPEGKRMEQAGYGLQLSTRGVELVAGVFSFTPDRLAKYREAVLAAGPGAELEAAAGRVTAAGEYRLGGQTYKRVPRGFDAEHPRAEWLRYSGLHVFSPVLQADDALEAGLVERVMKHFRNMSPIERWLARAVYG